MAESRVCACHGRLFRTSSGRAAHERLLGGHHTAETKQKMSEAKLGKKHHYYGKHFSEKHRRKISEALRGRRRGPFSEEHRRKISEAVRRYHREHPEAGLRQSKLMSGENHPRYGKHHTPAAKRKIAESMRGLVPWNKGLTAKTDERMRKISESMRGKRLSTEHRQKISEAGKKLKEVA